MTIIKIDGSQGEGGGQVVRTSMSLAAILGRPINIYNIRANRATSGLQPQHVMACQAAAKVTNGQLSGAEKGSRELFFHPSDIQGGHYTFDIGTAGATTLVAQTLLPILIHANSPSLIKIIGGTHLPKSPSYDYFENIFLPAIRRFGAQVSARLDRPGYYPGGGGMIEIAITPSLLKGNKEWEISDITHAIIRLSRLPSDRKIGQREADVLAEQGVQDIRIIDEQAFSPANVLTLWNGFRGASHLGERGKLAEKVALELWEDFTKENGQVDSHLADQLLLYAALAHGMTSYGTAQFTSHFETNREIILLFLKKKITFHHSNIIIKD